MKKIKIIYFIDFLRTEHAGTESQLIKIIERLDKDIFNIQMICLENNEWIKKNRAIIKCPVYIFDACRFKRFSTYFEIYEIVKLIRILSPDIVHTFFPISNVVGVIAARIAGVKKIISSRRDYGQWMNPISLPFTRFSNLFITRVIVNSEQVRQLTAAKENVDIQKIDLIHNGIDIEAFEKNIKSTDHKIVRKKYDIPDNGVVIGIVANHRPMKHLHTFIEAAAILLKKKRHYFFFLVGDGLIRRQLEDLSSELEITKNVLFVGRQKNVIPFLAIFDVGVNCSDAEGLSNALIETMLAGIPCVVTDRGGNPSLVKDNKTGMLFQLDDSKALAQKIEKVLSDDNLRNKVKNNGYKFIVNNMHITKIINEYTEYYKKIA